MEEDNIKDYAKNDEVNKYISTKKTKKEPKRVKTAEELREEKKEAKRLKKENEKLARKEKKKNEEKDNNKEINNIDEKINNTSENEVKKITNEEKKRKKDKSANKYDNATSEPKKKKNNVKAFKNLLIKLIFIALMGYITFGYLFGAIRMNDQSMLPNITEGSLLFYYRIDKNYNIGDVILFNHDGKDYVLRIVAKEGQKVEINDYNELLVDGYPEEHATYYETEAQQDSAIEYPYTVESGKVFVLGDYRLYKEDSRIFGAISIDEIKGKIIARFQVRNI